jgi:hypothetical protein
MDHTLYNDLCNTKVERYEEMMKNGIHVSDIGICLLTQLDELVPGCERYIELIKWAHGNFPIEVGIYYLCDHWFYNYSLL